MELETQDNEQILCKECARELQERPCEFCKQMSIELYPAMDQNRTVPKNYTFYLYKF